MQVYGAGLGGGLAPAENYGELSRFLLFYTSIYRQENYKTYSVLFLVL
jgi:hypothetical protein